MARWECWWPAAILVAALALEVLALTALWGVLDSAPPPVYYVPP
ncbi:MAG: hypothetical protein ACK44W_10610 [Planctomycetota bacterium]